MGDGIARSTCRIDIGGSTGSRIVKNMNEAEGRKQVGKWMGGSPVR